MGPCRRLRSQVPPFTVVSAFVRVVITGCVRQRVRVTRNCNVVVSDLYVTKFKASATAEDITGTLKNPQNFRYGEESLLAWQEGRSVLTSLKSNKSEGIFKDKKAMLSFTTGSFESMRRPDGISGISVTLWPLQNGILRYPGPTDTLGC
ncbi:hypothetical protein Z043_102744 [Scleropages formosus]|uniref:Uncharacterized protein n=1 Tax=Scleropages formosus TaxID=113540 RepID=A0A0P7UTN8_SCLFO|nr:hypothetical protein Z043_102744 [Scleropages formosus]